MADSKHILNLSDELTKISFSGSQYSSISDTYLIQLNRNKKYIEITVGVSNISFVLSGRADYMATMEIQEYNSDPYGSCSFSSDFKVIGSLSPGTSAKEYVELIPTDNKVLAIIHT